METSGYYLSLSLIERRERGRFGAVGGYIRHLTGYYPRNQRWADRESVIIFYEFSASSWLVYCPPGRPLDTVLSSPSIELSTTPLTWLRFSYSQRLSNLLLLAAHHICTATLQLDSTFIPLSPIVSAFLLSNASNLEYFTIPMFSPYPRH